MGSAPGRVGRKRARRIGCGCLAACAAALVGLVVCEWVLRVNTVHLLGNPTAEWGKYRIDEQGSPALIAGWTGEQEVDGRTTSIRINSMGMRGPELGARKPGELRVLVLGDSFVHGFGVAEEESFVALLQEKLNVELGVPVTVGNGGVSGTGTYDLAPAFDRHRDFAPDAVVACTYIGNDFSEDTVFEHVVVEGYRLGGAVAQLARASWRMRLSLRFRTAQVVERFLRRQVPSLAIDVGLAVPTQREQVARAHFPPKQQLFTGLFQDRREEDPLIEGILARYGEGFDRLRVHAGDIPVLAVIIPSYWHLSPEVWDERLRKVGLDPADHEFGRIQRRLLEILGEDGPVLDLTPLLQRSDPEEDWLPVDRHWAPAGHRHVAEWLVPEVRRLLGR